MIQTEEVPILRCEIPGLSVYRYQITRTMLGTTTHLVYRYADMEGGMATGQWVQRSVVEITDLRNAHLASAVNKIPGFPLRYM